VVAQRPEPWLIHFFQRDTNDDPGTAVPAMDFLATVPVKVAAEIHAILKAVSEAPPPAFSGGGKWEAMHGDMAGLYEVRVRAGRTNHRLFCLLARDEQERLGGPSIVCLGGLSKPARSAARRRDYEQIKQYADEFARHRQVYRQ
jgi:Txe/YoeB family toxin of Txe-Axe toxin-antitoxin module